MSAHLTALDRVRSGRESWGRAMTNARRSVIWGLLRRNQRDVKVIVALTLLNIAAQLFIANATVAMVDNAIVDQAMPLRPYVVHIARLAVIAAVLDFASRQYTQRLAYQIEFDLRAWLYTRVQWADLRKLASVDGAQVVTRGMTDLRMMQNFLQFAPTIVALVPITGGLLLYLLILSPPLAIIAAAALPLNLWLLTRFRTRLWGLSWAELNERAEVAAAVDEPVRGIRVVRAFGREPEERRRLAAVALSTYQFSMTRVRLLARYDMFLKAIPLLVNAIVLFLGARLVASESLTLGVFLVAFQVAGGVTKIAQIMDELSSGWQYLRGADARVGEVLAMGSRPREGGTTESVFSSLELADVGVDFDGQVVIRDLSVEVRPGELVSLVGPPSSGKTTVARLVGGLLPPTRGEVLLDGQSLSELDITTIRRVIRIASEEPVLFSGTVRQNIDLGASWQVSDEEIHAALYAAGAEDIVAAMPEGLDTTVGDRGLTLSGGQRQRLALARALVSNPRVLVLDDALSAVNPAHEVLVLRRLREFLPGSALICISRRDGPTTIADRVIELPARRAATAPPSQSLVTPDTGSTALMDVVRSLEISRETPLVGDAQSEVDEMPTVGRLGRFMAVPLATVLGLLVLNTLSELGPQLLFSVASDAAEDRNTNVTDLAALAVVGVSVVYALSAYALRVAAMKVAQSALYLLRRRVFHRLSKLGIDYYDRELPGEVATRVVNDLDTILQFVAERAYRFMANMTMFVVAMGIVIAVAPAVTGVVLGLVLVIVVLTVVQLVIGLRAYNSVRDELGATIAMFEEHFTGREELRGCGAQAKANEAFVETAWRLRQRRRWATSVANAYNVLVQLAAHIGGALVLLQAGYSSLAGAITIGTALSARLIAQQAIQPLPSMGSVYTQLLEAKVSWDRLRAPFAAPLRPTNEPDATAPIGLEGDVTFEHVSFTYPDTTKQVLDDVSFTVPAGVVTALVGFTGAGKSSIAKLITRIYDPTGGVVRVGGVDIRRYESAAYRRRLGIVPQDAFLFKGTLRSNLAYGRLDATDDEIHEVLDAVGAAETLSALEGGLDHPVEPEARNLTAAQRQLVALARVWLAQPDILILDEATSCLDGPTEERVLDAIAELGVTTLTVTHRDVVADRADKIIVLEAGHVVEEGRPDALVGTGSAYDRLWAVEGVVTSARPANGRARRPSLLRRRREPLRAGDHPDN